MHNGLVFTLLIHGFSLVHIQQVTIQSPGELQGPFTPIDGGMSDFFPQRWGDLLIAKYWSDFSCNSDMFSEFVTASFHHQKTKGSELPPSLRLPGSERFSISTWEGKMLPRWHQMIPFIWAEMKNWKILIARKVLVWILRDGMKSSSSLAANSLLGALILTVPPPSFCGTTRFPQHSRRQMRRKCAMNRWKLG